MALRQDLSAFGLEDRSYSVDEWLAIEARTGERFEYHEGQLVHWRMMAGGSLAHSEIGGNLVYLLGGGVRRRERDDPRALRCGVHASDLRIKIPDTDRYVYPDAAVVCGPPVPDTRIPTAIRNPVSVAEVLSPSSVQYDTGVKFRYYASLGSLREYVLVSQEEPLVEVRSRTRVGGAWDIRFVDALDGAFELPVLGVSGEMRELYRGIDFGPAR